MFVDNGSGVANVAGVAVGYGNGHRYVFLLCFIQFSISSSLVSSQFSLSIPLILFSL